MTHNTRGLRPGRPRSWRTWRGGLVGGLLAAILFVQGVAANAPVALAAGNVFYVNGSASNCTDSGSGTQTQPFCTIGKGAQLAQAGDTVAVIGGTYTGTAVNPSNSGASGSPITFTASAGVTISGGNDAFAISGRSYIVINGFTVSSTTSTGISVSSSNNITISNNTVTGAGQRKKNFTARGIALSGATSSLVTHNRSDNNSDHGIYLSGGSANNTVSFNEASFNAEGWQRNANGINVIGTGTTGNTLLGNVVHDNEDSGLQFFSGANNGLAVDNVSYNNGDHGIDDYNVIGGRLIGNTIYHNCTDGINVEGTSGGYLVENNVSMDNAVYPAYNGISCSRRVGNIGIYDSAPATTTANFNLVNNTKAGGAWYVWAGTTYNTQAALTTATGQEANGIFADPKFVSAAAWNLQLTEGSPGIDSADSGVSGEQFTDILGNPRVDDPSTPNAGTGPRPYDDRGAYEFQPATTSDTQPPSVPAGLAGTVANQNQVTLTWGASTDNVGVTGYTVYRNGATLATVTGSTLTYADKTVADLTAYSYAVDAFDAAGNHSPQSTPALLNTPDWTPPSAPTGLSALVVSSSEIDLSWQASTDNVGVAGYTVYRNGAFLATVGGSVLSDPDRSVAPATTYSYTVDAFDAAGNHSILSPPAGATTPGQADTTPPSTPAGLTAQVGASGEVDLAWGASTDNVGVTGYTVYRNGTTLATVTGSTLTYADKTVADVTAYSYAVDAFDAAGNHSPQSTPALLTTPDWSPPSAPTGLSALVVSSSEIDLAWQASTDNVGVAGYTLYRNGTAVATTASGTLTYADTGLGHGFTYTYTVTAHDAAGNVSAQSAAVLASTPDDIPPTTPGGLSATATSPTNVLVSWTASTDNVVVTGYDIYRDSAIVATVGGSALTFTDTVASGSTHSYTVDAFDAAGNHSGTPTAVTATTSTADTTPPSTPTGLAANVTGPTQVSLAWNASTDNVGVTGYTIYRNGAILTTVSSATLAYADTAVTPATNYSYAVDAFDAAGNHSSLSSPVSVSVSGQPKFVQGKAVSSGGRMTSMTMTLGSVTPGDLLVGWFGQYDSSGQVTVSDNVNGVWTRSVSTTWHGGTAPGDIALYYFANSAAAPNGLTITITAVSATYLQGGPAEYSGVATVNPLDQVVIAKGSSTSADSGLTPAVGSGELVYGGMVATSGPGTLTPGTSQGVTYVKRAQSTSGSQGEEDIVSSAAGQQHAGFTFANSTAWFMVCAVFKAA